MSTSPAARRGTIPPLVRVGRHTHLGAFVDDMVLRAGQRATITTRSEARVSECVVRRWNHTTRLPISCTVAEMLAQVLSEDEMFLLALGTGHRKYTISPLDDAHEPPWSSISLWADLGGQCIRVWRF